jgi:hypothetical protein
MSKQIQDQKDLVKDIKVVELPSDGLNEDVKVLAEDQQKKDDKSDNTPTGTPTGTPEVKAAVAAAPVAMAPHTQGVPEAPVLAPEVQKAFDSVDTAIAAAPKAVAPTTKAGLISAVYQHMSTMKTEDLANVYQTMTTPSETPKADEPKAGSDDSKAEKSDDKKDDKADDKADDKKEDDSEKSDDKKDDKDEEKKKEKKDAVKEDLDAAIASETTLSEGFKAKAHQLFESAVKTKVATEVLRLEENYQTQLNEEVAKATAGIAEKADSYLSYVVGTWMEENKVAIDKSLRVEIAENFINSLKGVFKEAYIEVPEGKTNLVDDLNGKVAELEEQLLKSTESNMKLNENNIALQRSKVLDEASSGLASTEAAKLTTLTESVDFENAEAFAKKVQTIKETFVRKITPPQTTEVEALNENTDDGELTPTMEAYSTAISRTVKKS